MNTPPVVEVAERPERPPALPSHEQLAVGSLLDARRGATSAQRLRHLRRDPVRVEIDRSGHYRALPNTAVRSSIDERDQLGDELRGVFGRSLDGFDAEVGETLLHSVGRLGLVERAVEASDDVRGVPPGA